jgi:peptidoglycan/LPS O-acetylase OafA/YrhL
VRIHGWLASDGTGGSRVLQLDLLRGVAILLVLFAHSGRPPEDAGWWGPVVRYLQFLGPTGVDLFFVLSGFLIGGLLYAEIRRTGRLDVRRFLIRRGFRIWPLYFAFLAFVAVRMLLEGEGPAAVARGMMPNLLHLQNYLGSPREHTWSLAVEEHFYLVLPFLLLLLSRRRSPGVASPASPAALVAIVLVLCALLRLVAYADRPGFNPHYATHLRIDSLLVGVALAHLYHLAPERLAFAARARLPLLALAAALLLSFPAVVVVDESNLIAGTIGFAMLYVGYACSLLAVIHTPLGVGRFGRVLNGRAARVVATIGYFSYPIYLWHMESRGFVERVTESRALTVVGPSLRWLAGMGLFAALAVIAGTIAGVLLEKPSLALRDRLFPAGAPSGDRGSPVGIGPGSDAIGAGLRRRSPQRAGATISD